MTFWTFLAGAASLSALPLVTAGYYSKDLILYYAWTSRAGSPLLWAAGLAGALLTAVYTFRMVFLTFFGEPKAVAGRKPGLQMKVPLVVLAVLSIVAGFIETPASLGNVRIFSGFLFTALPPAVGLPVSATGELILEIEAALAPLIGVLLAYLLFLRAPQYAKNAASSPLGSLLHRFWSSGWGFDLLYDRLLVRPFLWFARIDKGDFMDLPYAGMILVSRGFNRLLVNTQTGKVRWYAAGIAVGAILTLSAVVFL